MKESRMDESEFRRWIIAGHAWFEIFEGRYDAYPVSLKWVQEWFDSDEFNVRNDDTARLTNLRESMDYSIFGMSAELGNRIDQQFEDVIEKYLDVGKHNTIGFAVAPYLLTWNLRRFKKYFGRVKKFSLIVYFEKLSEFIKSEKYRLIDFRKKKLLYDDFEEERVKKAFEGTNRNLKQLGLNENEPVGTSKLLHVVAPWYFPLLDNSIAEKTGLKDARTWHTLTSIDYIKWMVSLKTWLLNYIETIDKLEHEARLSILKLVDECLYLMSTVTLSKRITNLGLRIRS